MMALGKKVIKKINFYFKEFAFLLEYQELVFVLGTPLKGEKG